MWNAISNSSLNLKSKRWQSKGGTVLTTVTSLTPLFPAPCITRSSTPLLENSHYTTIISCSDKTTSIFVCFQLGMILSKTFRNHWCDKSESRIVELLFNQWQISCFMIWNFAPFTLLPYVEDQKSKYSHQIQCFCIILISIKAYEYSKESIVSTLAYLATM